jgi:sulfotransferase
MVANTDISRRITDSDLIPSEPSPASIEVPTKVFGTRILPIFYVAGLPRSGSTLLMNLLAQHPRQHATPSCGLIDMMLAARNQWMNNLWFKAEGLDKVQPKILAMMRGMIAGFHESALAAGQVVFDKNRGWLAYIELLEEILQEQVKIIVTVRDIKAIIASFEKIHRKSALTKHTTPSGPAFFDCQTIKGRARQLLSPGAVLGISINRLRDAVQRGVGDRLIIVPYRRLAADARQTMDRLHNALGLARFAYDPEHVEQITREDDSWHGMELHHIRSKVEPPEHAPWEGILPPSLCAWLDQEYADINQLAAS